MPTPQRALAHARTWTTPSALSFPHHPQRADLIEQSHLRCAALGVTRVGRPDFDPLMRSDLCVARERNQRLFTHAAPVMEMLFEQIVDTESMIVLTDAQGTILHSVGDDEFLQRASKVALAPGVNWAEPFDFEPPLHRIHMRADVPLQFYALLYIPGSGERNMFSPRKEPGLKLYARKVLIDEYNNDLLPEYLQFVQGAGPGGGSTGSSCWAPAGAGSARSAPACRSGSHSPGCCSANPNCCCSTNLSAA